MLKTVGSAILTGPRAYKTDTDRSIDEHWKTLTYEPLDDPEYIPTGEGRIEWTLKGYHGTPDKPNKEIVMRSPSIQIGGYYWNIKLYPRGNENTDLMSVYVECSMTPYEADKKASEKGAADPDSTAEPATTMVTEPNASQPDQNSESPAITSAVATDDIQQPQHSEENESSSRNVDMEDVSEEPSWEVPAQVLCIAYNPEEPRVYAYQKVTHRYHKETSDWGWTRFHGPWDRLHKRERFQRRAMLQNDTLSFTAYIRTVKDDTGALWWHSPSHSPEWDSFERLGLNRLWVGSPESSAVLCALSTWLHLTPLCPSIKAANYLDQDRTGKDRARPLFEELEQIRHHHSMPLKNTDPEAFSLVNVAEMLDWNDAGNCEPDVVSNLDILRRTLSCEALGVKQVRDSTDIFDDILFIRQPSNVPIDMFNGNQSISSKSDAPNSPKQAPSSVQQTLSTVPASTLQLKDPSEPPAILQIELHRQEFDVNARKWRKLTHRIGIDQSVTLDLQGSPATHYTLFSMAIHCGDLESKDYYSVIRPQGPGTRWIKYSGDKSSRGVECLTTKQAIEAHEGSDEKTADVDAVAYLVAYVRTNLLSRLSSEPIASNTAASQTGSPEEDTQKPENEERVPVYVYESSSLKHHIGLGIADWDLREGDKNQLLRLEVPESTTLGDLVDSIDSAWTSARNGVSGKYALWFLDTVKGNPAMRNVVRAPEIIPLSLRGLDAKLKDSHNFDKVCRILLDDDTPEVPEPSDIQPPPPDNPATDESNPEDSMQVDGDEAEHSDDTAAPAEDGQEPSTGTRTAGPEEPRTENGDTLMEGNPDPDAISGTIQPTASRQWNANLNTKALGSFDDIFVFLKVFDAEEQSLKGVTTFWVKGNEKVGYTIRKAMSWDDDVPIEVYQEQSLSTLEEVRSGSTYQDVAGLQNYIMVVQRTPNDKERSRLEAAGKPTTILGHFSYQCSACDPAYLQPHLTRSYFASPYFSGDIAYGRAHGKGTLITTLGDAYTGGFISGSKSGHGKMRFANGDTYTGSWANDDPNGHGEMVYAKTGNVYTGGFRKRKRHGKGVMKFEVADEEEHLCGICYEEEMDCCFYDCGHLAACEGCARQVDVCPVCRRGVKAVVRIWRS